VHQATTDPEVDATPCLKCHGDVSGYLTGHQNGSVNFSFYHLNGTTPDGGAVGAYSAAATPGVVTGTCSNVDCHYETVTQAWDNTTDQGCTSCHGATLPNAHTAHTGSRALPQTGQNDCYACHDQTVSAAGATCPRVGSAVISIGLPFPVK
jgi:predicted CxxxxCH...CXXCH cytochrome family protein